MKNLIKIKNTTIALKDLVRIYQSREYYLCIYLDYDTDKPDFIIDCDDKNECERLVILIQKKWDKHLNKKSWSDRSYIVVLLFFTIVTLLSIIIKS